MQSSINTPKTILSSGNERLEKSQSNIHAEDQYELLSYLSISLDFAVPLARRDSRIAHPSNNGRGVKARKLDWSSIQN
jgi:hypothetical protein